MAKYKHILFCTDITAESAEVARCALDCAQIHGAELSVIHVVQYMPMVYGGGEFTLPPETDLKEVLIQDAEKHLELLRKKNKINKNNCYLKDGNIKEEITQLVQEKNIDLLIVGGHDRHGLALLFGSTADTLVHALPCDILVHKIKK